MHNNSPGHRPSGVLDNELTGCCFSSWDVYIPPPFPGTWTLDEAVSLCPPNSAESFFLPPEICFKNCLRKKLLLDQCGIRNGLQINQKSIKICLGGSSVFDLRFFIDFRSISHQFSSIFESPNPCFDWQAHRILHIPQNAMRRLLHSIFVEFSLIFRPIFNPKTLQNSLRDPIETNVDFWYPFFRFWGRFLGPRGDLFRQKVATILEPKRLLDQVSSFFGSFSLFASVLDRFWTPF